MNQGTITGYKNWYHGTMPAKGKYDILYVL